MADCEYLARCPFFNDRMAGMPALASLVKQSLCKSDSEKCARYIVCRARGRAAVPSDLFPDDVGRAMSIVQEAGR